jgi:hypothetical protein
MVTRRRTTLLLGGTAVVQGVLSMLWVLLKSPLRYDAQPHTSLVH